MNNDFYLGYLENNLPNKVFHLFDKIKNPSEVNLIILFNACSILGTKEALDMIKNVLKRIPTGFYSNTRLISSLLDGLMRCGDAEYAQVIFDKSKEKSLSMYGAMMSGYNEESNTSKTLHLYKQMKRECIDGNIVIFLCIIKALSKIGDYSLAKSIIEEIPDSFFTNIQLQNSLIDMWVSSDRTFHYVYFMLVP